jgi:hypothetical protein
MKFGQKTTFVKDFILSDPHAATFRRETILKPARLLGAYFKSLFLNEDDVVYFLSKGQKVLSASLLSIVLQV